MRVRSFVFNGTFRFVGFYLKEEIRISIPVVKFELGHSRSCCATAAEIEDAALRGSSV